MHSSKTLIAVFVFCSVGIFMMPHAVGASIQDEINQKQAQIQELQRQIDAYEAQAETAGAQSRTLQNEIAKLNAQIGQITAQIKQLNASIDQAGLEIRQTSDEISDAERTIALHRGALAQYLRITDQADQQSFAQIVLQNETLSDFFDYIHRLQLTQENISRNIQAVRQIQQSLDDYRNTLEGKKEELERLKGLTEIQQRGLATTKSSKNTILKETKGQEVKFQQLIKQTKQDLERLKAEMTYLQANGITVEDAVKYGQLAAIGAGIRPAFLLALLEIESHLGRNVGTGNWRDDMYLCYQRLANYYTSKKQYYLNRAETEKNAYFKVVTSLGLDPDTQKVSKEPSYGCGGAMGPAQFIPSTWLSYAESVMRLTGRSIASPWNTEDAFTAAAIKLARGGATSKTRAGEVAAAKSYIGGNPNCSQAICNSYANTVLQKATEIERNL